MKKFCKTVAFPYGLSYILIHSILELIMNTLNTLHHHHFPE
ncbi:hypothetical protein WQG_9550 [Bibersteinia trehalosi USDA-ARS-USMARC-192]|uniref:Uncharacterized protein n=1 Tax=Bibersteinia trehalosi USDA-ARS-USMARC-190 TaxID=1263832 RepID=W0R651_BIBTR|nr:hypothetical protein WQG_9550 [Bibersteinia trehalosi USDA-ARS-USMARC-192]AHG86226.1 hypothetical protein F544_9970 [Bibersteinia trehalosi USDA-ARS-USMARC-190]